MLQKLFILICFPIPIFSQNLIQYGDFEQGDIQSSILPKGWYSCGHSGYTPPSTHVTDTLTIFGVTQKAYSGSRYISMVTRADQSVECIGQFFEKPLGTDATYQIDMALSISKIFKSRITLDSSEEIPFDTPADIEAYGLTQAGEAILIGAFSDISNTHWKVYSFWFEPKKVFHAIEFRTFYRFDEMLPYNGHILIDAITLKEIKD